MTYDFYIKCVEIMIIAKVTLYNRIIYMFILY